MKQSKHTPGPWVIETYHGSMFKICKPDFKIGDEVAHRLEADKALISAAPEMLEALEHGVAELMKAYRITAKLEMKDVDGGAFLNETVMRLNEVLKSAIAKSRGES